MAGASETHPTLSLVVPLHNSRWKADRLLRTLEGLDDPAVEIVLVDDGSTDGTPDYLRARIAGFRCRTRLIVQDNRGPGGARNTGLAAARGRYIWFIDSDDDVDPAAIAEIERLAEEGYDFIDFDVLASPGVLDTMGFAEGPHTVDAAVRQRLVGEFGAQVTKAFRRRFLGDAGIGFPAYCIFEDHALMFIFPLLAKRFYKSHIVGYRHHPSPGSVTRTGGKFTPRLYDQLLTQAFGLDFALAQDLTTAERASVKARFTLFHREAVVARLLGKRTVMTNWPNALRVMRAYRAQAARLRLSLEPPGGGNRGRAYDLVVRALWRLSRFLPDQQAYFARARRQAWPRPIEFPRIALARKRRSISRVKHRETSR